MRWPRYNRHLPSDPAERPPPGLGDGSRRRRADLAFLTALASGLVLLALLGPLEIWRGMIGANDFSKIWAGSRALLIGADPYDPLTWSATAVGLGTAPPDTAVYLYPPWVAIALLPLAALPLATATVVWTAGGLAAAAIALRTLLRAVLPGRAWAHAIAALLLVFSPPGFVTLITGQWTFVLVAALATTALLLRGGRPILAGLTAVLLIAKPQLFVFTVPALALAAIWPPAGATRGDRRWLLVAGGVAVAVVGIAWVLVPSWWPAWLRGVAQAQVEVDPITISTALRAVFGPPGVWLAAVVLLGSVAVAFRFHPRSAAWLPVWLSLSSAATVYSNTYDLLLLVVPLVLGAGAAAARGTRWRPAAILIGGAVILGPGMAYLHQGEGLRYAGFVPLAVFALITALLWRDGSATLIR